MNTVKRFKAYLDAMNIKNAQAERACGLSNGLIKSALSAGSAFGSDKLEKILMAYKDLSAEWLLRGEGSMLRNEVEDSRIKELESRLCTICKTDEQRQKAYDIVMSMLDVMAKTYNYFAENI